MQELWQKKQTWYRRKGGIMQKCIISIVAAVLFIGCTPKETHRELQTFSPIMVDMTKVDEKDYSELITAVNTNYAPKTKEYIDARLFKEEGMFIYVHVYSGASTACYRVTVDRNRSRIINIQPDCAIEEDQ
jgi:hypothetical protein